MIEKQASHAAIARRGDVFDRADAVRSVAGALLGQNTESFPHLALVRLTACPTGDRLWHLLPPSPDDGLVG